MVRIPSLEYTLSHPHPYGHFFLIATIVLFLITLPILVLVNVATLGFDIIPSLQPQFKPNNTYLEAWWGTRRLPPLLRPRPPPCQPQDLGRGDNFRVSGSLFDYTVLSTWHTASNETAGIQDQERIEYHGESFSDCYVNSARYDYSLSGQTHTITVGVMCPGYADWPVQVAMQSTITYALEASADFVGQYYGARQDLGNVINAAPTDYRKVVLTVIEAIGTDAVSILRQPQAGIPNPPLSMRIVFNIEDNSPELIPVTSMLTYANGTQLRAFPEEAFIYAPTIYNLAVVTVDAVNLDLGSYKFSNIYRNKTRSRALNANLAPTGVDPNNWALPGQDFYSGNISAPYQTWAQSILAGNPVQLGEVTGLPTEYVMTTSYLCPSYRVKPLRSLLASVFVGSATMTLSVWGAWMVFTTYLARQITAPQVICHCKHCETRREREAAEAAYLAANPPPPNVFTRFMAQIRRTRPPRSPVDEERAGINIQPLDWTPPSERPTDAQRPSYFSSPTGEKS